jgi:hypothetical protein
LLQSFYPEFFNYYHKFIELKSNKYLKSILFIIYTLFYRKISNNMKFKYLKKNKKQIFYNRLFNPFKSTNIKIHIAKIFYYILK